MVETSKLKTLYNTNNNILATGLIIRLIYFLFKESTRTGRGVEGRRKQSQVSGSFRGEGRSGSSIIIAHSADSIFIGRTEFIFSRIIEILQQHQIERESN
jgi:hypothetical protein